MLYTIDMPSLKLHPLAEAFPAMTKDEFRALLEDIHVHGLHDPITLYEGKILDGRHRYMACTQMRRDIECVEYTGDNPLSFVISKNEKRRHLTPSQLAMVAGKLATFAARGSNQFRMVATEGSSRELPSKPLTIAAIAENLNVGQATIKRAKVVVEQGSEETIEAVSSGHLSVNIAETIVKNVPRDEQTALMLLPEREIIAKAREINARNNILRRQERMGMLQERVNNNTALTVDKKYNILLVDPPWKFEAGDNSRAVENHYPTMTLQELAALPVQELSDKDSILFMWATIPFLANAILLMETWGFNYKSHIIWNKPSLGLGFWVRAKHELLLIGTRGAVPAPAQGTQSPSVIEAPIGRHSAKPALFAELIEALYPGLPRIELFCRSPREGWATWGNEAATPSV